MSSQLHQYLIDTYESRQNVSLPRKFTPDIPIQIDDQDENDKLNEFCNIYCMVKKKNTFKVEMVGNFPITQEIADLADIYEGFADSTRGRLMIRLNTDQIEVLMDLADKIRKTSFMGPSIHNPSWLPISARTISSLYRFVRTIKEFSSLHSRPELNKKKL